MPSSPGPGDDGTIAAPPSNALSGPHATCPPEEDRNTGNMRDDLGITDGLRNVSMNHAHHGQHRALASLDEREHAPQLETHETFSKHVGLADSSNLPSESPSPVIPQDERQNESRPIAQSMSPTTPQLDHHMLLGTGPQRVS